MGQLLKRSLQSVAIVAALGATSAGIPAAYAADWELDVDGRLVSVNGPLPIIDGGLGALRFGADQSGTRLGRARLAVVETFGEIWSVHLDASSWGDHDKIPVGATEAYLQLRPYPRAGYRLRIKAGAFYAPISLENRSSGWESPYTLSYSAIDSWLGQELRTIGAEAQLDWLGTRSGHDFDLGLTAGVFGWNDDAGAALANGGFTLTDRQSVLWGRVGKPGVPPVYSAEPFREVDGKAGVYGGLEARYLDRAVIRFLHYDNEANPAAVDAASDTFAWKTRFDSVGARVDGSSGWTAIFQWLGGETDVTPQGSYSSWPFRARYVLLSKHFGQRHTLSARYDQFEVEGSGDDDDGWQKGHALTLAYVFRPGPRWRCTLEWLHVVSTSYNREEYGNGLPTASQTQLQLAIRYSLGPLAQQ
jgi:hypothetical protein